MFAGLATLDVVHRVEVAPGPDAKATATRQDVAAGGPAAVAALAFVALGGQAVLYTALGGQVGRLVGADLAASGVAIVDNNEECSDWSPPVSAVRVSCAGRSVTSPDAAKAPRLTVKEFGPATPPGVVLVDGHHPDLARAAAGYATATGTPLLVDLGRPKPVFDDVLPLADLVVASADHAGDLGALLRVGPAAVAVTAGAGAIRWATTAGSGEVAVAPVDAVDTLGAGDVFHGAIAFVVAQRGLPDVVARWPDVLAWASRVAAVRVTTVGPHAWRTDPRLGVVSRG